MSELPLAIIVSALASLTSAQGLVDPSVGTLELASLPSETGRLDFIDGLAFDRFGNLLGAQEISAPTGGVVYLDKASGLVTSIFKGFSRVDQLDLQSGGLLLGTREVSPAQVSERLLVATIAYDAQHRPLALGTVASDVVTSAAIDHPEGLVVLRTSGAYGAAGSLLVCEDLASGRILRVSPDGTVTVLASGLPRPEGMAFGDFAGAATPALYVAETSSNRVRRVAANGALTTLGNPGAVALTNPDNLEFGPDGFLYISEDRVWPNSRIVRVAADGTHTVFATGFGQAAGMAFDPSSNFLYIAEQDLDRIWRVRFSDTQAPVLTTPGTLHLVRSSPAGSVVQYTVTAHDDLDPQVTLTCTPPSGALFPPGRSTVQCQATDDSGNVASASFDVFVHTIRPR